MSELSRRDLLQSIALSVTLGGLSPAAAQHVHNVAADEKASTGVYKAKALNPHEYQTLERLAELIIPPDEKSPGAVASGACEFIDLLASQNPSGLKVTPVTLSVCPRRGGRAGWPVSAFQRDRKSVV